jgi:hypothetical protein
MRTHREKGEMLGQNLFYIFLLAGTLFLKIYILLTISLTKSPLNIQACPGDFRIQKEILHIDFRVSLEETKFFFFIPKTEDKV